MVLLLIFYGTDLISRVVRVDLQEFGRFGEVVDDISTTIADGVDGFDRLIEIGSVAVRTPGVGISTRFIGRVCVLWWF
jgi:hypothetical protein